MLVLDEPAASAVRTALEGSASGCFETQTDLIRFLKLMIPTLLDKKGRFGYRDTLEK